MVDNFKIEIMNWLRENKITTVEEVVLARDFAYETNHHTIRIGIYEYDHVVDWFREFLQAQGCSYTNYIDPVLSFLHELGHSCTMQWFSEQDLDFCDTFKKRLRDMDDWETSLKKYWTVADELAANKWVIEFIQRHGTEVTKLQYIFLKYWGAIKSNENVRTWVLNWNFLY